MSKKKGQRAKRKPKPLPAAAEIRIWTARRKHEHRLLQHNDTSADVGRGGGPGASSYRQG